MVAWRIAHHCFVALAVALPACLLAVLAAQPALAGEDRRSGKELERLPAITPVVIVLTDGRSLEGDYDPQRGVISVPVGRGRADIPVDIARVAHWSPRRPAAGKAADDLLLESAPTPVGPDEGASLALLDDGSWEAEAMCAYLLEMPDIVGTVEHPGGTLRVVMAGWNSPDACPQNIFVGPVQEAVAGLYGSRLLLPVARLPLAALDELRKEKWRLRVPRWVFAKEPPLCDPSIREPLTAWHREFRSIVGAWDKAVLHTRRLHQDADKIRSIFLSHAQRLKQLYQARATTSPRIRAQTGQYVQYYSNPDYERILASIRQLEGRQEELQDRMVALSATWPLVQRELQEASLHALIKLQQLHRLFIENPEAVPEAWRAGCFP